MTALRTTRWFSSYTTSLDVNGLFAESGHLSRGNWAYAIADVFADLDSTDPFRRTYASVLVVASGFAVAGLAVAAVGAGALGAAGTGGAGAVRLWPAPGAPAVINGVEYTQHALERMAPVGLIQKGTELFSRGVPPTVVENAIEFGRKLPGQPGTMKHVFDNVVVVTNEAANRVITVWKGR